jgi:RimJ/RimL family protein N-acetyltransferase
MIQAKVLLSSATTCQEVVGKRVTLRLLCEQYIMRYIAAYSPLVQSWLHVSDIQSELLYVRECVAQQAQGATYFFCIFDAADDAFIGAVEIRKATHRGQLYAWLNERYWGRGLYQEALALASRVYFAATGLVFFTAHVDVANKRSYYALRKANFAPIGLIDGPHGKQYMLMLRNALT